MTTIGRGSTATIAAACDDGTVRIYDSITGVLRLSLNSQHRTQAMTGSPDGSILFCTHQESPSITLWDVQTGGLIHIFTLTTEATDTAISLNGRYLACGLSDGTVNVWEVANRTGGPAFGSGSPITCLCWLAPEERFMVADGASVHIRDIVTGSVVVHNFKTQDLVRGAAYSQNQLAVMTSSRVGSSITVINTQTGKSPVTHRFKRRFSCIAFSQTAKDLVCGMKTRGLALIHVPAWNVRYLDLPAAVTSVSTLSNRTVVANVPDTGLQLLSLDEELLRLGEESLNLDEGYTPSREPLPPALTVHPLDKGKIIAIVPISRDCVILLEMATMRRILTIPGREGLLVPTDRTVVLCASLAGKTAVHCFVEGDKAHLQLLEFPFRNPHPVWTAQVDELPSAGDISPGWGRLVTFHYTRSRSEVRIWNANSGKPLARLNVNRPPRPLDITFSSEDVFHVCYDTYRTTYVVSASPQSRTSTLSIDCLEKTTLDGRERQREYCVDDSHEWVVSGSQRICWIPPGYIGSDQASHCWAGSTLVMAGQDGTLRKLTFRESSL